MKATLIFVFLFGMAAAANIDQRGFFGDLGNNIIQKYKDQIEVFQTIYEGMKAGKGPSVVIKEALQKHPHTLKNFTLFTAACDLPVMQTVPAVGPACKFIDDNMDKLIAYLKDNQHITGAAFDKVEGVVNANKGKQ